VRVPEGAPVRSLPRATLLPGFVDAHVHLVGRMLGEGDWQNGAVRDLPAEDVVRGVRNARVTLEAGFTTVRNVGAGEFGDVALRKAIEQGVVPGPRIVTAGHAVGISGGHCDENGFAPGIVPSDPLHGVADGPDEAVKAARLQMKFGAEVIKICATGGVLSEGDAPGVQQMSAEEIAAVVREAHLAGRKVAAHAHGSEGILEAVRAGVDSIEHGTLLDDAGIQGMKERGTFLVPTLSAARVTLELADRGVLTGERAAQARMMGPRMGQSLAKAARAGVKVALGTDAGVGPHGQNAREFGYMVEAGLTPMQAIVAGTRGGAELLGLLHEIGTVEKGKVADLVAVPGDPLADVHALEHPLLVVRAGRVVFAAP
jgi:imidazolonepropionase-like amidohydrolase